MAIKGKSRRRSKARGPALPPKPAVGARKTPLPMRKDMKRAAVIVLAVLAVLGGLRVWQNVAHADSLRAYSLKLSRAQEPLLAHLQQGSPTEFKPNVDKFSSGSITAQQFITLTDTWEKDFRKAVTAVQKLKAPGKVEERAQKLMADGLDGYVGVARLYNLAGQIKLLADAEKDAKQKQQLTEKVQVIVQHAQEWNQRADTVYSVGSSELNELRIEYGLAPRPQPTNTP